MTKAANPASTQQTSKSPPRDKAKGRQRIGLAMALTGISFLLLLAISTIIGFHALQVVYEHKLRDTWAILFLDLEQSANRAKIQLEQRAQNDFGGALPDLIFRQNKDALEPVRGDLTRALRLKDLGLGPVSADIALTEIGGRSYVVKPLKTAGGNSYGAALAKGQYLLLWQVEPETWLPGLIRPADDSRVYLATRQGRVLYANTAVKDADFIQRPLVQSFIAAPFAQGQIEFNDPQRGASFGFYHEIRGTNVMIFSETTKAFAMRAVREVVIRFGGFVLLILGAALLIFQFPLQLIARPIRDLSRIAREVAAGNFHALPRHAGIGEVYALTEAFRAMSENLLARDERIKAYVVEQEQKLRLDQEIALAREIQTKLLPQTPFPLSSSLDVATVYRPATEVAGDWFAHVYDESSTTSLFAIADVTGHGAGSALLAAVIATAFRDRVKGRLAELDLPLVLEEINSTLWSLGGGQWSATMILARVTAATGRIDFANAGHEAPILMSKGAAGDGAAKLRLGSPALGMVHDFKAGRGSATFAKGDVALLYTDGLIHSPVGPAGRRFGRRQLGDILKTLSRERAQFVSDAVVKSWSDAVKQEGQKDDLCILTIKAA